MFKEFQTNTLKTKDNINISYNIYENNHDTLVIIAHGWFMSKDSKIFLKISESFARHFDVITFDFRGHCASSGFYTFGADETTDLKTIIDFAKNKYNKIHLIGFSLGALIAINYCANYNNIAKLILISAPTKFDKIENNVFSPNAFIPTLKKFELKRWLSIRFTSPFKKKPIPIELISKIEIPTLFIAGEKDPIIKVWHNTQLFKKATCHNKKELIIKNGKHAEDIYIEHKKTFMKNCLNWLKETN